MPRWMFPVICLLFASAPACAGATWPKDRENCTGGSPVWREMRLGWLDGHG